MTLDPHKIGVAVDCTVCGRRKPPIGRSVPMDTAGGYCDTHDCPGWQQEPRSGSLWPGESEADFGYPVGTVGTTQRTT